MYHRQNKIQKKHITLRFKDERIWSIRFNSFMPIASFWVFDSEDAAPDSFSAAIYKSKHSQWFFWLAKYDEETTDNINAAILR
jgi:hypothetical protein